MAGVFNRALTCKATHPVDDRRGGVIYNRLVALICYIATAVTSVTEYLPSYTVTSVHLSRIMSEYNGDALGWEGPWSWPTVWATSNQSVTTNASANFKDLDVVDSNPSGLPWSRILVLSAIVYTAALVFYRIYLSPLAAFPGPFLAKATHWYEFYHNFVRTGKYYEEIKKMHEKYGAYRLTLISAKKRDLVRLTESRTRGASYAGRDSYTGAFHVS